MKAAEIRLRFLDYFAGKDHEVVASSSLVPHGDPTLLFTNAGMVQFKNVFLGHEKRDIPRAASSQKCVRAGGKHNDLENVGHTARHHTFFEMLGNFSFGDYFKCEAIGYAWEFLTAELGIDPKRLFVTVFDEDDEAAEIWLKDIGVSESSFARIGAKDNFWSMGDTGPCGPCSEIFYDHGPDIPGGPPGSDDAEGDRFTEIWNLVFMQFDRDADGRLNPLPNPCVDTGMGLERITAVMQGVHSNYEIDLLQNLIGAASKLTHVTIGQDKASDTSLRVIADHLRAISFLIADGVMPSNEGRGFVLRRILRRASRHGRLLGMHDAFLHRLVPALVDEMGGHFVELTEQQRSIAEVIRVEETRFIKTLDKGLKLLDQAALQAGDNGVIAGKTLFTLYDTFGFPLDLTADILKGRDIGLDMDGFEACMEEQRSRARAAWAGTGETAVPAAVFSHREEHGPSEFLGYATIRAEGVITGLIAGNEHTNILKEGEEGWLIANQTPFYGESGGQVGDKGKIETEGGTFVVTDARKPLPDQIVHIGRVESGCIEAGTVGRFHVDAGRRDSIRRNHTATHLLHGVLKQVLGDHVKQAGSLVAPERLRFDFTHVKGLSEEEVRDIESRVNAAIWNNDAVDTHVMSYDDAVASGAVALFGEKYGDEVRVVQAGFSTELCGGTHVYRTGDIGPFRIVSEAGIAAGVRRIEAVTGPAAYEAYAADRNELARIASELKASPASAFEAVAHLRAELKAQTRMVTSLTSKQASGVLDELVGKAVDVNGIKVLAAEAPASVQDLRDFMDKAKAKLKSGVLVFGVRRDGKVQLIAGVTKDLAGRFHAGKIVNGVAEIVGGKGGGKPDMAMAGGNQPDRLPQAINQAADIVKQLDT